MGSVLGGPKMLLNGFSSSWAQGVRFLGMVKVRLKFQTILSFTHTHLIWKQEYFFIDNKNCCVPCHPSSLPREPPIGRSDGRARWAVVEGVTPSRWL